MLSIAHRLRERINATRVANGLPPFVLVTIGLVKAAGGGVVSSTSRREKDALGGAERP